MNNQIVPQSEPDKQRRFDFEGREVRTVIGDDGEPRFVAADICTALDIQNIRQNLAKLDDDEKGVCTIYTLGGPQEMNVVNESGLYNLIFNSRKAEAKRFKKWVTSEVLPALRKFGMYSIQRKTPEELALMHAQLIVEHSRHLAQLDTRQDNIEERLSDTQERLSRVEARQITMIGSDSQHMSISAYCVWKNIDTEVLQFTTSASAHQ